MFLTTDSCDHVDKVRYISHNSIKRINQWNGSDVPRVVQLHIRIGVLHDFPTSEEYIFTNLDCIFRSCTSIIATLEKLILPRGSEKETSG